MQAVQILIPMRGEVAVEATVQMLVLRPVKVKVRGARNERGIKGRNRCLSSGDRIWVNIRRDGMILLRGNASVA
jgi:hypothetical protein